jgi:multidrug resistance efflux pump
MSDITRAQRSQVRRKGFILFAIVLVVAGLAYGAWWWLAGRFSQSTDDAYVAGNIVAVTSRENATVTALYADNTQGVRQGQLLIEMDPSVADVTMRAAEANPRPKSPWRRRKAIIKDARRRWPARCRARSLAMPVMRWRRRKRR